ncbi:hypothetical protein AOQ84DRAFT_359554 [Glonium stellatum]|uniref:Uncharacterized protein n=1 Tax=Glonium stellatum TaxID=574774 RepID=A0A8E2FAN3_9PEZI|nr:hypothetical protein AOQ84DRAFT_359554 [Glonium stellatum]
MFFLPDATFYHEVRVGGPTGSNAGGKWLPFNPPATPSTRTAQLDELIALLTNPEALEAQNTLSNLPTNIAADLAQYSFPFKIGDADRPFDGVVNYWHSDNTRQASQ